MLESPGATPAGARPQQPLLPHLGLLVSFLLEIAEIARGAGSILDVLLVTVVVQANLAELSRDPELQQRYAGVAAPPPDALRRPVNISTVAAAVGLPYETARRRLNRLAELGQCEIGPAGVVVPAARVAAEDQERLDRTRYEATRRFYGRLRDAGALEDLGAASPGGSPAASPFTPSDPPVRLCNRLLSEYYLRVVSLLTRRAGDPVGAVIVLGLARANLGGAGASPPTVRATSGAVGAPVRRSALAAQVGLPPETVRRRLIELEARGFCRSVPGGVVIDADNVLRTEGASLLEENTTLLREFLARLRDSAILALWDLEPIRTTAG